MSFNSVATVISFTCLLIDNLSTSQTHTRIIYTCCYLLPKCQRVRFSGGDLLLFPCLMLQILPFLFYPPIYLPPIFTPFPIS